ncbi:MAG: hypothetical protein ACLTVB_03630 [Sutterella sp.]
MQQWKKQEKRIRSPLLPPYRLREALEEVHSAEKIYRRYYQALLGKALKAKTEELR